jgi:ribosome-binding protein aMBF1 (putative translation factor)
LLIDYRESLKKEMQCPDFKQAWDSFEFEYILADLIIKARNEAGLSQEELAKK